MQEDNSDLQYKKFTNLPDIIHGFNIIKIFKIDKLVNKMNNK